MWKIFGFLALVLAIFTQVINSATIDYGTDEDGEYGDKFEGDMILSAGQLAAIFNIEISNHPESDEVEPIATVSHELSTNCTEIQHNNSDATLE